jgi:hypothetical protein
MQLQVASLANSSAEHYLTNEGNKELVPVTSGILCFTCPYSLITNAKRKQQSNKSKALFVAGAYFSLF